MHGEDLAFCTIVTRDVTITGVTVNHDKNVDDNNYRVHFEYHYYHG